VPGVRPRRFFVAATRQNQGKTSICLGLMAAFQRRYADVGFIKPVGQRYTVVDGQQVDEDSVLIDAVCHVRCALKDMSPVAVGSGFTERYLRNPDRGALEQCILSSFARVAEGQSLVLIEGTGHAGVGSVFDLSNAAVASLLGASVVIVSGGGIGAPIDEIMVNRAMFQVANVPVLGAIINKVHQSKYEKINELVRIGLARYGVDVLGVIPYVPMLAYPSVALILEETGAELLCGQARLETQVQRTVVGAMSAHAALDYLGEGVLLITPGTRTDVILGAVSASVLFGDSGGVAGIVLTGDEPPHDAVLAILNRTDIPVLAIRSDTYSVTSAIHDVMVKGRPSDTRKIETLTSLVEQHVEIDRLMEAI
jgi:BioD-like phosphotransacetylase family protein